MNIEFYRPMWGINNAIELFTEETKTAGFIGLEGALPKNRDEYDALRWQLQNANLKFIGEIATGGTEAHAPWIPKRNATMEEHLSDLGRELRRLREADLDISFANCMGGLDAWPLTKALRFFEQAMELAETYEMIVSFETHRTRCLYSPWTCFDIVTAIPEISITADLSHWCVVAERLLDDEDGLTAIVPITHHIHGRVGYDQGPQVPNPSAPEYAKFVQAHQRWWERIWAAQEQRGYKTTTMSIEYGTHGYLQRAANSEEPTLDLWEIMQWARTTEYQHFERFKDLDYGAQAVYG